MRGYRDPFEELIKRAEAKKLLEKKYFIKPFTDYKLWRFRFCYFPAQYVVSYSFVFHGWYGYTLVYEVRRGL